MPQGGQLISKFKQIYIVLNEYIPVEQALKVSIYWFSKHWLSEAGMDC